MAKFTVLLEVPEDHVPEDLNVLDALYEELDAFLPGFTVLELHPDDLIHDAHDEEG